MMTILLKSLFIFSNLHTFVFYSQWQHLKNDIIFSG